jgi:hypothetical protein
VAETRPEMIEGLVPAVADLEMVVILALEVADLEVAVKLRTVNKRPPPSSVVQTGQVVVAVMVGLAACVHSDSIDYLYYLAVDFENCVTTLQLSVVDYAPAADYCWQIADH